MKPGQLSRVAFVLQALVLMAACSVANPAGKRADTTPTKPAATQALESTVSLSGVVSAPTKLLGTSTGYQVEPPVPNVTVSLYNAAGKALTDADGHALTTKTDASGRYTFTASLPPQAFVVKAALQSGDLAAIVAADGPRQVDINLASTLVADWVLADCVQAQVSAAGTVLNKLPASTLADALALAKTALKSGSTGEPTDLADATVLGTVQGLASENKAFNDELSQIHALLVPAGVDLGTGSATTPPRFEKPRGIAFDKAGNLYVADTGANRIRKVDRSGNVTTLAGSSTGGDVDASGTAAEFDFPRDVAVDANGNVFVADTGNRAIRKITPEGVVSTYARGVGITDPSGLAFDAHGNLFLADGGSNQVLEFTTSNTPVTIAGSGGIGDSNATGLDATFNALLGMAIDASGTLFVTEAAGNRVREISRSRVVSTLAGSGITGEIDATGTAAAFDLPAALDVDSHDDVFVADTANNLIREISPKGRVTTIAGGPKSPFHFNDPQGIAIAPDGNIWVADTGDNALVDIGPAPIASETASATATTSGTE
ncbi:MAG TPA: hypothetical protein V6D47_03140 [Oscillatoriaceae cyanobacterium]